MPNYRRWRWPGSGVFLTLVTCERRPIFAERSTIRAIGAAMKSVRGERPFQTLAAVVMPDHLHLIWRLPPNDADYSARVAMFKLRANRLLGISTIWQPRFWEHLIRDQDDFLVHADYIHFNPVKHGVACCPHEWPHSTFTRWVERGDYSKKWGCVCRADGEIVDHQRISIDAGE